MLNVTWERKDLSFNNQGFLSNPSMVIIALDRERIWDKVASFDTTVASAKRAGLKPARLEKKRTNLSDLDI